jgi:hypothetical protein
LKARRVLGIGISKLDRFVVVVQPKKLNCKVDWLFQRSSTAGVTSFAAADNSERHCAMLGAVSTAKSQKGAVRTINNFLAVWCSIAISPTFVEYDFQKSTTQRTALKTLTQVLKPDG